MMLTVDGCASCPDVNPWCRLCEHNITLFVTWTTYRGYRGFALKTALVLPAMCCS